jgi:hypothetical protein
MLPQRTRRITNENKTFRRKPYDAEKGFKATVIKDEEGKVRYRFTASVHTIAVKAFDVNGLEGLETIKLKVNDIAQTLKLHLASWNVHGDKTNEPACLKKHLGDLFTMFPCLKLLTGDAIFAQRPLLEAIQEYQRDYLVQVKENQPKVHAKMKQIFKDVEQQEPSYTKYSKKKKRLHAVCG